MIIGSILCPIESFSDPCNWKDKSRVSPPTSTYRHFENYEKSDTQELIKQKLEAFAAELHAGPQYYALLISYAGKEACKGEAKKRADAVKRYSLRKGVESARIKVIDGGFQEEWVVELYLVLNGKKEPLTTPTIKPASVRIIESQAICKTNYDIP